MALFVIYGYQNSGKTHTAWLVYNLLKAAGSKLYFESHPAQNELTYAEILQHITDRYNAPDTTPHISDFRALIEYKGKKVAIFSAGDCVKDYNWAVTSLVDNLDWAKQNGADHIVCCSRYVNRAGSVQRYLLDNYNIYKLYRKSRTNILSEQLADIQKVAEKIFTDIKHSSMLQSALQDAYNQDNSIGEVGLFQRIIEYFECHPKCTPIEMHQHYVQYGNPVVKCEISDILFVSYSKYYPWMKINFLQAKKADFNNRKEGLVSNNTKLKFSIDKNQYNLLKDRPEIDPLKTGLPKDILSNACNSSITSYGVFYNASNSSKTTTVEFAFEITDLLQPTPKVTRACFGTIDTYYGCICNNKYCHCHCWHEPNLLTTLDTDCFENALLNFQIGSPIEDEGALHLAKAIEALLQKERKSNHSFRQFMQKYEHLWKSSSNDNNKGSNMDNFESLSSIQYVVLVDIDNEEYSNND